ncbi:MAG: amidohydrolase [Bacillota bacterium]|nr:amidohydrolase [Bacillota bacterium]
MSEIILIQAEYILTWDDGYKIISDGEILIEDSLITYTGPRLKRSPESINRVLNTSDSLVMPGFINTHTHAAMTLFRSYADDMSLMDWLQKKIWPVEAKLQREDIYWGTMLAILEMLKGGTTCFADMYFFMDEVARACGESGIRASISQGLIGIENAKGLDGLKESSRLVENWHKKDDGRITVMLGPHAPYTCPPAYLQKVASKAAELGIPIHIHLSETRSEVEECRAAYGKTPIELMDEIGLLEQNVLAAHCVHLTGREIEIISEKKVAVAHNPGSNLKLGSGVAPLAELLKKGALVSLGTDGASSNNNLDMVEEMRLAALLQKGVSEDPTVVTAEDALTMATLNGAKSLFLDEEIGTLRKGSKADLIMFNLKKPHFYPLHNLISHLVYSAASSDVELVMVNGKFLMEKGKLLTIDEERILFEAQNRALRLVKDM